MYKIALVNVPFAAVQLPSIALTQLRSVLLKDLGDKVEPDLVYLNHDLADFMGLDAYGAIADSPLATVAGLGDWLSKPIAFPELEDDPELYFQRHFRHLGELASRLDYLLEIRQQIGSFLDRAIDRYELDRYAMVGCTSMFQQNLACFALMRKLKERNPRIVTAMGGANCEIPMGQVIADKVDVVDFVFSGPALKSFPEFVGHLIDGEGERCHQIRGVLSHAKLARLEGDPVREIGEELPIDVEVPLDYDDFMTAFAERFGDTSKPVVLFETSRGCWWGERSHCTFCGLNGLTMAYRGMAPPKALKLFEDLFEYAPQSLRFEAVDNIMPREYLTDVLPHLEAPEDAHIFYEVKADLKAREMAVMAKAGVTRIQPGIEALATSTLKLMKKGTTAFQNVTFLKNCVLYGIEPAWNLLIGFPGEEEETYAKYFDDLPLLTHLQAPIGTFPVRFDRFSPYFKLADEYGLELVPYDFYFMLYPFDEETLSELAYYFVDENFEAPYMSAVAKWIQRLQERIDHWTLRWQRRDGLLKPELRFTNGAGPRTVYDSRTGVAVIHELDAAELAVLDRLAKPTKPARLAKVLDADLAACERRLAGLAERGLIFQERGLYMSLVVDPRQAESATA